MADFSNERFAMINLRGVCTKLYFNLIFTMQTYKELIPHAISYCEHSDWLINRNLHVNILKL